MNYHKVFAIEDFTFQCKKGLNKIHLEALKTTQTDVSEECSLGLHFVSHYKF